MRFLQFRPFRADSAIENLSPSDIGLLLYSIVEFWWSAEIRVKCILEPLGHTFDNCRRHIFAGIGRLAVFPHSNKSVRAPGSAGWVGAADEVISGFRYQLAEGAEYGPFFGFVSGDDGICWDKVVYQLGDLSFVSGVAVDC